MSSLSFLNENFNSIETRMESVAPPVDKKKE